MFLWIVRRCSFFVWKVLFFNPFKQRYNWISTFMRSLHLKTLCWQTHWVRFRLCFTFTFPTHIHFKDHTSNLRLSYFFFSSDIEKARSASAAADQRSKSSVAGNPALVHQGGLYVFEIKLPCGTYHTSHPHWNKIDSLHFLEDSL